MQGGRSSSWLDLSCALDYLRWNWQSWCRWTAPWPSKSLSTADWTWYALHCNRQAALPCNRRLDLCRIFIFLHAFCYISPRVPCPVRTNLWWRDIYHPHQNGISIRFCRLFLLLRHMQINELLSKDVLKLSPHVEELVKLLHSRYSPSACGMQTLANASTLTIQSWWQCGQSRSQAQHWPMFPQISQKILYVYIIYVCMYILCQEKG
jgi:hypothetical protein